MPEGPEIETIRRNLQGRILGRQIQEIKVITPRQIYHPTAEAFVEALRGCRFETVGRRGKYLLLGVGGQTLVCHLRMSGRLVATPAEEPMETHTHVIFSLDGALDLRYIDQRKFGGFHLVGEDGAGMPTGLARMGPDAIEELTSPAVLAQALQRRGGNLKTVLLDQSVLGGIGNIYADEILHRAYLHPLRAVASLRESELDALYEAIGVVLSLAVQRRGTTFSLYRDGEGKEGDMYSELAVFDQTGRPCPRCETPIRKVKVAGRGTHICPHCQPPPDASDTPRMRTRKGRSLLWTREVGV